jgi:hypothetical protein
MKNEMGNKSKMDRENKCTQNVDVEISVAVVAVWGTWA